MRPMALELITGHAGSKHISAQDDGAIMRSVFGDNPRPFMSTGDKVVQTGKIIFNEDDVTVNVGRAILDVHLTIPFSIAPFYQTLPNGSILVSDDKESFTVSTPDIHLTGGFAFIVILYITDEGSLSIQAAVGDPVTADAYSTRYDAMNTEPNPPSIDGIELRRLKIFGSVIHGNKGLVYVFDLTPCVPPADAAIDWLTIDRSDQLDPPNTDAVNLITIYDEPRTAITTAAGSKIAAAWKTYNTDTNEITDLPAGVASKLGNVEAHVYVRGNYGESLIRSGYNEGGYFSVTGYADFDGGQNAVTLSPTGNDNECFAFVVDLPFSYHKGMTQQVLNGSGYAVVGGTGMASKMG